MISLSKDDVSWADNIKTRTLQFYLILRRQTALSPFFISYFRILPAKLAGLLRKVQVTLSKRLQLGTSLDFLPFSCCQTSYCTNSQLAHQKWLDTSEQQSQDQELQCLESQITMPDCMFSTYNHKKCHNPCCQSQMITTFTFILCFYLSMVTRVGPVAKTIVPLLKIFQFFERPLGEH